MEARKILVGVALADLYVCMQTSQHSLQSTHLCIWTTESSVHFYCASMTRRGEGDCVLTYDN